MRNVFKQHDILMIFLLLGCMSAFAEEESKVATVSGTEITQRDVLFRIGTEDAYGGASRHARDAVVSLINDTLESSVASKHGILVSAEDINAFSKYVDENSKAPEILSKVKAVFKGDEKAYARLYLSPKILNRKLRYFYSRDVEIHKLERAAVEKAYSLVMTGKAFQNAASALKLDYSAYDIEIGSMAALVPMEVGAPAKKTDAGVKNPLESVVEKLALGAIYDHIVEDDYSYQVVKLVSKDEKKYSVEAITSRKRSFDDWFSNESHELKVTIFDANLKKAVQQSYPDIPWVKTL